MQNFVITCVGLARGADYPVTGPTGQYLRSFDPAAGEGRGRAEWTADPRRAKRFATMDEAREFWVQQSEVKPLREDGEPNRPLTAYNVIIATAPRD